MYKEFHPYWLILNDPLRVIEQKVAADSDVSSAKEGWTFQETDAAVSKLLRMLVSEGCKLNEQIFPAYKRKLSVADAPSGSFLAMGISGAFRTVWASCVKVRKLVLATELVQDVRRDRWPTFTQNELFSWSKEIMAAEVQRRLRELEEIPFTNVSGWDYVAKLGIEDPFAEQARFLQAHIEVIDALRDNNVISAKKDDVRMNAAKERQRREIRFDVSLRLETNLRAIEEIQKWKKEERRKVLNDKSLTSDEIEELLDQIDSSSEREKERVRTDVSIYEEA